MRTFFISLTMIFIGLAFGVTLTEVSLRVFMPELAQNQPTVDTGYIKKLDKTSDRPLNAEGFRETDTLADLDENSWFALGGSTAFGMSVEDHQRFSEYFEGVTGLKVYNSAQVGKGGDMAYEFAALKRLKSKANKVVYVIDMGLPPHVHLGLEPPANFKQKNSIFSGLALAKVLSGQTAVEEPKIEAWTEQTVAKYARNLATVAAKYRNMAEHFIVIVVPARGHSFENSYGTIHRKNQEMMANALRQHQGIYAVDVSYILKSDYADPTVVYNDNNRMNAKGHTAMGNAFLRQYETFSTWKSFDELTPEEQAKVREDMERTQAEEAKKRAQNPF